MRVIQENGTNINFTPTRWNEHNVHAIAALEKTWAPWLQNSLTNIRTISKRFPQGQIAYSDAEGLAATMTTTRITWPAERLTWDQIAGVTNRAPGSRNFTTTFDPDGDTLCIMSSSVRSDVRRHHLGTKMLQDAINKATELNVEQIVGSFRPNGYGAYKSAEINAGRVPVSFAEYCEMRGEDNARIDPWLRIAEKAGMQPLESPVDEQATVIEVTRSKFEEYKTGYAPDKWIQRTDPVEGFSGERWECGEAGTWYVEGNRAVYIEPNYWMGKKVGEK